MLAYRLGQRYPRRWGDTNLQLTERKGKKMKIKATSLKAHGYGNGWQVNALVNGVESEATFYAVSKDYAMRQARALIEMDGRLPHEPYRGDDAIFPGFTASEKASA